MNSPNPPHHSTDEKLAAWLTQDLGEPSPDFLPIARAIHHLPTPEPVLMPTTALIERLRAEFPQPMRLSPFLRLMEWRPLLILRSQIRVIGREIWLASAFVLMLGALVTALMQSPENPVTLPLSILAPMVAIVGIGLLYDHDTEKRMELESVTATPMPLLLLARITLVYAFDLSMALLGTLGLVLLRQDIPLGEVISAWLLPMTFLSALAFFLSVTARNTAFSVTLSLTLWALHILFRTQPDFDALWQHIALQNILDTSHFLGWIVASVGLIAVALWMSARPERRFQPVL